MIEEEEIEDKKEWLNRLDDELVYHPFRDNVEVLERVMRKYNVPSSYDIFRSINGYDTMGDEGGFHGLTYNKKIDVLLSYVEGDLYVWVHPSDKIMKRELAEFPLRNLTVVGERYDKKYNGDRW